MTTAAPNRDYTRIERVITALPRSTDRAARMQAVVDAVWEVMSAKGISWVGFYGIVPARDGASPTEMTLLARRDKPACSPIGLHGACGRAWKSGRALIVTDVANLGEGYIACDPSDRSEVVLPLFEASACWGVLDVDSHDTGAFGESDVVGLRRVLVAAGLTNSLAERGGTEVV